LLSASWPRRALTDVAKDPGWMVNPVLFILVVGMTVLFVAAILYQILIVR
jgi:hypothetical protein